MEGERWHLPNSLAFSARWIVLTIASFALVAACGRSNLDDYLPLDGGPTLDGGLDAPDAPTDARPDSPPTCNAQTCASGCCDANDRCASGSDFTACGRGGLRCSDCQKLGFQLCDPKLKSCANKTTRCDKTTCGNGCCEGNLCLGGFDPNECGDFGSACQHCAQQGQSCQNQQCTQQRCGPGNCKGCCFGDQCIGGVDQTACGNAGQQCSNCAAQQLACVPFGSGGTCEGPPPCGPQNCAGGCCVNGQCNNGNLDTACGVNGMQCNDCLQQGESCQFQKCVPQTCGPGNCSGCCVNGQCVGGAANTACGFGGQQCRDCSPSGSACMNGVCGPPPPLCNAQTCPGGCCVGNVCAVGTQNNDCGSGGQQCQNCSAQNEVCTAQRCVPVVNTCTPQNCAGCCDQVGQCQPGFLNSQCGESGAACINCSQQQSTCDTAVSPRVCRNAQTQCPAAYPSCPASVTLPPPSIQHVCTAADLANARAACSGGAHSAACQAYFQFEQTQRPQCASCLSTFDYDFQEVVGLFECVSPFVSATCDHELGCGLDCEKQSCAQCLPADASQCQTDARNGQCRPYFQQSQCAVQSFFGPGAFCNPNNYGGNVGAWLQGVGGHYCGP
jgi:hypothetical protein